ncbi:MAG: hypothetical protein V2A73_12405 [Pseudomonadota bacterium]
MLHVLVGIDDPALGSMLVNALESMGHQVTWVRPFDAGPAGKQGKPPSVVAVDGEVRGLDYSGLVAAWRRYDPAPAIVILGDSPLAHAAAARTNSVALAKSLDPLAIAHHVANLPGQGEVTTLTASCALRLLSLPAGGTPDEEAAAIATGARHVPAHVVRGALRPHINEYVAQTATLARLQARHILTAVEEQQMAGCDGSRTLRGLVDSNQRDSLAAARLLWGLICGGALALSPEPPVRADLRSARLVGMAREQVRARRDRLRNATLYEVFEVAPDAAVTEVERAFQLLGVRFAPERFSGMDLGDLTAYVQPLWQQILQARATLLDPMARSRYHAAILSRFPDIDQKYTRRKHDSAEAEEAFVKGQRALAAGEPFRAVSLLATAARRLPDEPDYEAHVAWARFLADEARGIDRKTAAARERPAAEAALLGRRPRPRALLALGLLSEAADDLHAAVAQLREALACDPRLAPAQKALARLE